jgi:uncharacterized phage protein gp47/JayE
MGAPGLTSTGFVATTVDEEVTELNALVLAAVNGALDLSADQPIGQLIGIFAEKFTEIMELGATVYNAINPNAAEGQLLVNAAALSGTIPQVATYSVVSANLTLQAATTVNAGATAVVANQPTNTWNLITPVVNTTSITGVFPATFQSNTPGPFVANAGTLTVIGTPTIGWLSVTNPLDAIAGVAADTDTTLRQRRQIELEGEGSGTLDAIESAVIKVAGVLQVLCFENNLMATDSTGLPGKSFRVVVWDGPGASASNNAVAQAIWEHKPSGILAFGAQQGTATDSNGVLRGVSFDRAVQLPLYVVCTTTPPFLTAAGTLAVKAAIAAYGAAAFNLGVSVIDLPFRASALVAGVTTDVPIFCFGTTPSPTNFFNLQVPGGEIATISTTNILVNGI